MSDSERSEADDWDDMAIVRAFEDALADKRTGGKSARTKDRRGGRRDRAGSQQSDGAARHQGGGGHATPQPPVDPYQQSYSQPYPPFQQQQQQQQQQASPAPATDVYQDAYAQAYATIMAQMQAASVSGGTFSSFPPQVPSYASPRSFPSQANAFGHGFGAGIPTPAFHGPAGFMPGSQMHHGASVGGEDGLANLLLAWYQSGYYTGRFQAIQEMKAQARR